jgi:hypothetical protein
MTEINVDIAGLTDLKTNSQILIKIGETVYEFKPISLKIFTQYERLSKEGDNTDGKAFLLEACSVEPKFSVEEAEELPAGLAAVLVSNLLRASFLMLPASNE